MKERENYFNKMIGGTIARVLAILVGHLYPLYRTFKVCRIPEGSTSMDGRQIVQTHRVLAFWAVHGTFTFAEYFVDFFIFWFPLYYEAKVCSPPLAPVLSLVSPDVMLTSPYVLCTCAVSTGTVPALAGPRQLRGDWQTHANCLPASPRGCFTRTETFV